MAPSTGREAVGTRRDSPEAALDAIDRVTAPPAAR